MRSWAAAQRQGAYPRRLLFALAEAHVAEARSEARQATAAINQMLRAPCPGRMSLGVNVEVQFRAFAPIGRASHVFGPIGHDHFDEVIRGVNVGFHG